MIEVTASVFIKAPPEKIWSYMINIENWWVASNPEEHVSLESLTGDPVIKEGMPLRLRESVAGVPCEAVGWIDSLVENETVTWSSKNAVYRYLGLRIEIEEGVTWTLRPTNEGAELSARIWACLPNTTFGRIFECYARKVLDVERKDYEHALRELRYLKKSLEQPGC